MLPVFVEVYDDRKLTAAVVLKLVDVLLVERFGFIHGVMKFISGNAGVAGAVEVLHKGVHDPEESIFKGVIVCFVEPVNDVAPNFFTERGVIVVADPGCEQLI